MRAVISILFLAVSVSVSSQTNFAKQLEDLVKDSTNNFKTFKSNFKETRFTEAITDSIFYTSVSLDGTSNNELLISTSESIFMADVADSLTAVQGKRMVDEWRDKINFLLGSGFTIEDVKGIEGNPSTYGWNFIKGNLTISIGLYPHKKNTNLNWIGLAVYVFEDDEILAKKTD